MNRTPAVIAIAISLISWTGATQQSSRHVVLPNQTLLACRSTNCSQVWLDGFTTSEGIFPVELTIDIDNTSGRGVKGLMAVYDKSVSFDDLKSSIDQRYGKWTTALSDTSKVKLWRVEPEKFSIQLSADDDGAKHVIYMSFATYVQIQEDWAKARASQKQK
jgi:hypothetical protein